MSGDDDISRLHLGWARRLGENPSLIEEDEAICRKSRILTEKKRLVPWYEGRAEPRRSRRDKSVLDQGCP